MCHAQADTETAADLAAEKERCGRLERRLMERTREAGKLRDQLQVNYVALPTSSALTRLGTDSDSTGEAARRRNQLQAHISLHASPAKDRVRIGMATVCTGEHAEGPRAGEHTLHPLVGGTLRASKEVW